MAITLERAKALKKGDRLMFAAAKPEYQGIDRGGLRVTSKAKVWKTQPERVEIHVRYVMGAFWTITERELDNYDVDE